jgi:hypothetical protein
VFDVPKRSKKSLRFGVEARAEQDLVLSEIKPSCSDDEFKQYREMIGKSMGAMLLDVINPIVQKYPDLKPPQLMHK